VIKVGIVAPTGYGGREIVRLLAAHPEVEIAVLASTSAAGRALSDVVPGLRGFVDTVCVQPEPELLGECDLVCFGMPAGKAFGLAVSMRKRGVPVIDIGPDFRLKDPALYEVYYGAEHRAEHLLGDSVYGLPEIYRDEIRTAPLVAVPGCYATSIILPMLPLCAAGLVDTSRPAVINSVSGASGAGRGLSDTFHFPQADANLRAYKVGQHQHTPEIEQELSKVAETDVHVLFIPHTAPLTRGILTTIVVPLSGEIDDPDEVHKVIDECYQKEPFVRVMPPGELPETKYVAGSNFCDIGVVVDHRSRSVVLVCAIDNLVGGTAGMAVQCLNIKHSRNQVPSPSLSRRSPAKRGTKPDGRGLG